MGTSRASTPLFPPYEKYEYLAILGHYLNSHLTRGIPTSAVGLHQYTPHSGSLELLTTLFAFLRSYWS
jgi:hypothetical protein